MKKVIYSFLFCMCVMNIHAQLTLEATLTGGMMMNLEGSGSQWTRVKPAGANVQIYDWGNKTILKYSSSDFSLIETLNVVLDDEDDAYSFQEIPAGLYKNDGTEYYLIYDGGKLGVYKKVGNDLILDETIFNCSLIATQNMYGGSYILPTHIWSNGTKCFIFLRTADGIKVYSFAGTASNVSQVKADNTEMKPYPNPSHDKIHLTFDAVKNVSSIKVCDVNGRMIERIPVGDNATEYELDVHSYPEGVYFYEIDGKSQSFMVK